MTIQKELSFFNTIRLNGIDLDQAIEKTKGQNARVLELMRAINKPVTPLELHEYYEAIWPKTPYTSIRRAFTVLTDGGKLEKLEIQRTERYGKPNYTWRAI